MLIAGAASCSELQVDCLKRLVAELLLDNKWPGSGVKRRTGQRMIV